MISKSKIQQGPRGSNAKDNPSGSEEKMENIREHQETQEILQNMERVPEMRVKNEARPAIREALDVMERYNEWTSKAISNARKATRDGSKDKLEMIAKSILEHYANKYGGGQGGGQGEGEGQGESQGEENPSGAQQEPNANEQDDDKSEREKELEQKLEEQKKAHEESEERARELAKQILQGGSGQQHENANKALGDAVEHWGLQFIEPMVRVNKQVLLVGPAGTGKTFMGRQLNAKLGFDDERFYCISLSAGVSEAHLSGRMVFDGKFLDTKFLDIVENGGTILLDEFDNADPNVMVGLNSLLEQNELSVPLRRGDEVAKRHDDCHILASANTWGDANSSGAQGFVRNQMDSATLDRFSCSKWNLLEDRRIVNAIAGLDSDFSNYPNPKTFGTNTNAKDEKYLLRAVRDVLNLQIAKPEKNIGRQPLSPRILKQASRLVDNYFWSIEQVLEIMLQDWSDEQLRAIGCSRDYGRAIYGLVKIKKTKQILEKAQVIKDAKDAHAKKSITQSELDSITDEVLS